VNVRWRPRRIGLFLLGAWLGGSVVISFIVASQVQGFRYGAFVLGVWAVLFAGFTYFVLALALNSTSVRVDSGKLVVSNGPLPAGGGSSTDVREIEDVFASSYMTPGARGFGGKAYTVLARTKSDGTIPIVANSVLDSHVAEDLAREVEAMIWKAQLVSQLGAKSSAPIDRALKMPCEIIDAQAFFVR
jgi:hypothetical protein